MRSPLAESRRIVVKIGSSLLTNAGAGLDRDAIADWARQIAGLRQRGLEVLAPPAHEVVEDLVVFQLRIHEQRKRQERELLQMILQAQSCHKRGEHHIYGDQGGGF
jgi:hypothetical protein